MRNERRSDCLISDSEIEMVFNTLKEYEDKLSIAKEVVAKAREKLQQKWLLSLNSRIWVESLFSDFDY